MRARSERYTSSHSCLLWSRCFPWRPEGSAGRRPAELATVASTYTTGSWKPFPGHEEAFLSEWREFAAWARTFPGASFATLARDLRDSERYVSFMAWDDLDSVRAWKSSPEFKPRMARVQEHIDKFAPTELEVVAVVDD